MAASFLPKEEGEALRPSLTSGALALAALRTETAHGSDMGLDELPDELHVAVAAFLPTPRDLARFCATNKRATGYNTHQLWRRLCAARWADWPRYALTPAREAWLAEQHATLDWRGRYRHFEADASRTILTLEEMKSLNWHFNFTATAGGRGQATLKEARFTSKLIVPGYPPLDYHLVPLMEPNWLTEAESSSESIDEAEANGGGSSSSGGGGDGSGGDSSQHPRRGISAIRSLMSSLLSNSAMAGGEGFGGSSGVASRRQVVQIANFPPHWVERLMDTREWLIYNDNVTFVSCPPDAGPGTYDERGFLTDANPPEPAPNEGPGNQAVDVQ